MGDIRNRANEAKRRSNKLSESDKELIREISASTIDRMLKKTRKLYQRQGLSTTRPGGIIREMISIKTERRRDITEAISIMHLSTELIKEKEKKKRSKKRKEIITTKVIFFLMQLEIMNYELRAVTK